MFYEITTTDPIRRQVWLNLFGVDALPVKVATPRWQELAPGKPAVLAYDLDASRLTREQRDRFAAYAASKTHITYEQAYDKLNGWPLPEVRCKVRQVAAVANH